MTWELGAIFVTSFVVGLSGALTPGPTLAVAVVETSRRGFWGGPLVICGHILYEFPVFLALVLGLGAMLQRRLVFGITGAAGGVFLIVMATAMLRRAGKVGLEAPIHANKHGKPILAGLLTSVANPYFALWWATIGLSYIALSQPYGMAGVSAFYSGHLAADTASFFSIGAVVSVGGKRWMNDRVYVWILRVCGLFLLALGLYFSTQGFDALISHATQEDFL